MGFRFKYKLPRRAASKEVYWPEDPELEDIYSEKTREELLEQDGLTYEEEGFMKGYEKGIVEK